QGDGGSNLDRGLSECRTTSEEQRDNCEGQCLYSLHFTPPSSRTFLVNPSACRLASALLRRGDPQTILLFSECPNYFRASLTLWTVPKSKTCSGSTGRDGLIRRAASAIICR